MDPSIQCNPALGRAPGETCLPPDTLENLRRVWNRTHPTDPIPPAVGAAVSKKRQTRRLKKRHQQQQQPPVASRTLWQQLRDAMKRHYKCETEFCLIESLPNIPKKQLKAFFRPEKPDDWEKKPTTWLDSFNIEDVMNQYEEAFADFEFIGPVPIDFDAKDDSWGRCIVDEMCKLDIRKMAAAGTKKIGIVYNLDKHDEPGSHWVCSFVDIPAGAVYYFDSYGMRPPPEVERFMARCKEQGCRFLYYNDIRHQRKGSECGMYCLFVLICLLKGRSFYDICTQIVDDDTVNSFRDILFATEKPRREAIEEALPRLCI